MSLAAEARDRAIRPQDGWQRRVDFHQQAADSRVVQALRGCRSVEQVGYGLHVALQEDPGWQGHSFRS